MIACLVIMACAAGVAPVDHDRLADAIRAREGYRGRDGAAGERGPWQIRAAVWSMHMPGKPYAMARQEAPARACALKHLRWLEQQLVKKGVAPSVFNLAAAWNAGLDGYTRGRAPERAYEYARDVENIYCGEIGKYTEPKPAEQTKRSRSMDGFSITGSIRGPTLSGAVAFPISERAMGPMHTSPHVNPTSPAIGSFTLIQKGSAINQGPALNT